MMDLFVSPRLYPGRLIHSLDGDWSMGWSHSAGCFRRIDELAEAGLKLWPAKVPGNFELDLQANGLADEPFHGMNIAGLRKYEAAHIWYGRKFAAEPPPGLEPAIVFEGLDCFAEVFLNGERIGASANMLVEHVFPATGLCAGENELLVHLRPAVVEAQQYDYPPGLAAQPNCYPGLYVRKAPHMFGWDIMPRAVSAGIWRQTWLQFLPAERLETVWLETLQADAQEARLALHYQAKIDDPAASYEIEVCGKCGGSQFSERSALLFAANRMVFPLKQPRLWWPRDRGEQALYEVEVRLLKDGDTIDVAHFRHGIRTIELLRSSLTNEAGTGEFCFCINGERLFIRGTNWVPADAYHSRDVERIPRILALADELGCNMLRCWGGNVYEPDLFFDFCDEKGILVWQDFAMACAVYPRDDRFCAAIESEARKVIRRLRRHPSLALWAGDNECDQAYGWHFRGSPEQNRVTREVLPRVLADEDPSRPYLPSSPFIDAAAEGAGDHLLPENHLWGPRDYFKSGYYSKSLCHFASEIGYHGCPAPESVRRFISPAKLWPPGNDEWLLHATSPIPGVNLHDHRVALMCNQVAEMFGAMPENLEEFAFQSQAVQAEALKFFIELFRGAKWRRTGILWWNLMDGWPQFSDAVVDYYFMKKLAFEFIYRAQRPLLVMLREPQGWMQEIAICNDARDTVEVRYRIGELEGDRVLAEGSCNAKGDAVTVAEAIPFTRSRHRFLTIAWESSRGSGRNHYLAGEPPFAPRQYKLWLEQAYAGY